jgi:hypothetical protein
MLGRMWFGKAKVRLSSLSRSRTSREVTCFGPRHPPATACYSVVEVVVGDGRCTSGRRGMLCSRGSASVSMEACKCEKRGERSSHPRIASPLHSSKRELHESSGVEVAWVRWLASVMTWCGVVTALAPVQHASNSAFRQNATEEIATRVSTHRHVRLGRLRRAG